MKVLKEKKGIIISFIIGVIIASSITVYAYSYYAKDIGYTNPVTNTEISVETALNDLYNKTNLTFTNENVSVLADNNYNYTLEDDYKLIIVSWLTSSWVNTNYYTVGLDDPICTRESGNHYGLVETVYANAKKGNKIVLDGSATKSIIIMGIK